MITQKWIFAAFGFIGISSAATNSRQPVATVIHTINLSRRQDVASPNAAAIVPTAPGQIGINPPEPEIIKGSIGANTEYLTDLGGTTSWIGPDPSHIKVATITTTNKAGATAVATVTQGVSAVKNGAEGLDILLSPAVRAKLQSIAKQVTPCSKKRALRRRQGACGLADFVERVGADEELRGTFTEQLTDQVWAEIDEGFEGSPEDVAGWEGDGRPPGDDEGYFSDDGDGFFEGAEGAEGSEAGSTLEGIVFSSEEEAAAMAELVAGAGGGEGSAAVFGGATLTAGSFLAYVWNVVEGGGQLDAVYQIPKERIHKVTKTKTDAPEATSTSSSSCPTDFPYPKCGTDCGPTSVQPSIAESTDISDWACSEGKNKDCKCNPAPRQFVTPYDQEAQVAMWAAFDELSKKPLPVETRCPGPLSDAPRKFFSDIANTFCDNYSLDTDTAPVGYNIDGFQRVILAKPRQKRSPPENKEAYVDYTFFLHWKKTDGECRLPRESLCKDSFKKLMDSNCGINHGPQTDRLSVEASIDVGCGEFGWQVSVPQRSHNLPPQSQDCHDRNDGKHRDVHREAQKTWSYLGCQWHAKDKMLKPGDEISWFYDFMKWKISWVDGCTEHSEQLAMKPLGNSDLDCQKLMVENYTECTRNGGTGGFKHAGCLRYEFYL
ncbi:uncharacterized protein DNG_03139 [Cephalotrichum gorgonifer]|uniref:Uncharacterized protein n=1 Tax=Cephalotrichum gorgonifer TaxID=2041049 RepID=A0AAE8MVP1_9PEZI|nr:uncharacterized protein DNG_03139 [Cephalotrichum gorgonifer]